MKPNIIPSYTELEFYLRAPSMRDLSVLTEKVENCFKAAALATGCRVSMYSWSCYTGDEILPVQAQQCLAGKNVNFCDTVYYSVEFS